MSDYQWIVTLLRMGFLKASFILPKMVRYWRELRRYRMSLVESLGDVKRQLQTLLESSNVKFDPVVSVLFGKTGSNLMDLLAKDHSELTLEAVQPCLSGRLRPPINRLKTRAAPTIKELPHCISQIPLKASRCPHCSSKLVA